MATPAPHASSPAPPSPSASTTSRPRSQRPPRPSPSPRPPSFLPPLPFHNIRDFAYPSFHPLHLGPPSPSTPTSTTSTPARRLSDPLDAWPAPALPGSSTDEIEGDVLALPSTSFGDEEGWSSRRSHRKSRSQASLADFDRERERGRRRSSARRSRGEGLAGDSLFHFGASGFDPAGSGGLRSSRGQAPGRRDSHWGSAGSRAFHPSHQRLQEDAIPLDTEPSLHAHSPQRASMGPEDELFAGESLALYSFEPENSNELRLREGQVILVSYRHGQGWLVAEDPRTGEQGLVPEEYVRLVREIEGWDSEKGVFVGEDDSAEGEEEASGEASGEVSGEVSRTATGFGADGVSGGGGGEHEEGSCRENEASEAMLVDPPEIDHQQGLQMKNVSKTPVKGGGRSGEGEVRQDSACAER